MVLFGHTLDAFGSGGGTGGGRGLARSAEGIIIECCKTHPAVLDFCIVCRD